MHTSSTIGFFSGGRATLWEEKIGLREKFAGNAATQWGQRREPDALALYERLTGQEVSPCMFRVKAGDDVHGWLGASPDGLVAGMGSVGGQHGAWDGFEVQGARVVAGKGDGLVEIKCPYNRCAWVGSGVVLICCTDVLALFHGCE